MKTKIINNVESKEINWSKAKIMESNINKMIVLANGRHDGDTFSGMLIIPNGPGYSIGHFSRTWIKDAFTPITEPITIEFNPE